MMNPFEMVVLIVLIVTIGKVIVSRNRRGAQSSKRLDRDEGYAVVDADPDSVHLRNEVRTLKERIAVLERIATDGDHRRGLELERQIEALRDEKRD